MYNRDPIWVKKLALIFVAVSSIVFFVEGARGILGIDDEGPPTSTDNSKEAVRAKSINYGAMDIAGGVVILVCAYYGWKAVDGD